MVRKMIEEGQELFMPSGFDVGMKVWCPYMGISKIVSAADAGKVWIVQKIDDKESTMVFSRNGIWINYHVYPTLFDEELIIEKEYSFKQNDRVYTLAYGYGLVSHVDKETDTITVDTYHGYGYFRIDGRFFKEDLYPQVFPSNEIPKFRPIK